MQESENQETTTPKPLLGKEGRKNIPPPTESRSAPFVKGELQKSHPTSILPSKEVRRKSPIDFSAWALAGELGYTIAIPIVIFALLGRWADKAWGTSPWLLLAGIVVSIMISSFAIYRKVKDILK